MKLAQIARCRCGSIIGACVAPYCYEDKEWQKDLRNFIKQGCTTEYLPCDSSWRLGLCECALFTNKNVRDAFLEYSYENGMDDEEAQECVDDFINNFLIKRYLEDKRQLKIKFED